MCKVVGAEPTHETACRSIGTVTRIAGWAAALSEFSLQRVQQFVETERLERQLHRDSPGLLARADAMAADDLGPDQKAWRWLQSPSSHDGEVRLSELLDGESGLLRLEKSLGAIRHGCSDVHLGYPWSA